MLYAIAAICVSLVVLVLIGKPIRIEIIHTVTEIPAPPMIPLSDPGAPDGIPAAMAAMAYVNDVFHNVKEEPKNGNAK